MSTTRIEIINRNGLPTDEIAFILQDIAIEEGDIKDGKFFVDTMDADNVYIRLAAVGVVCDEEPDVADVESVKADMLAVLAMARAELAD